MAAISGPRLKSYIQQGKDSQTAPDRGRALEDMICYVFGKVPGISITHRDELNVFHSEEIDVACWNERHPKGLPSLPDIILIECKNVSRAVGSIDVSWFDTKLENRGLSFGILVSPYGVTGSSTDGMSAYHVLANSQRDGRRIIVITLDELLALTSSEDLVLLVKKKLCLLAVRGTAG